MDTNSQNKVIFFSLAKPETPEYYLGQINFYISMPEPPFEKILQLADAGLAQHPKNINLLAAKSNTLCKLGRYSEEEVVLREALELLSNNAALLQQLGDCILRQGNVSERGEEILWLYEEAAKNNPNGYVHQCAQSAALLNMNRPREAWHVLQSALQLKPDNPVLRYNYGLACLKLGINDEATRKHLEYASINNLNVANYALAAAFKRAGQKAESDKFLKIAINNDDGRYYSVFLDYEKPKNSSQEEWHLQ